MNESEIKLECLYSFVFFLLTIFWCEETNTATRIRCYKKEIVTNLKAPVQYTRVMFLHNKVASHALYG